MSFLRRLAKRDEKKGSFGRHAVLLASLVALLVALPVFQAVGAGPRFSILLMLVLTATIYVNSLARWTLVLGMLTGGGAIAGIVVEQLTGSVAAGLVSISLGLVILSTTILLMLNSLIRSERVSRDTIVGGICVYLLLGLSFAMAYLLYLEFDPGGLVEAGAPLIDSANASSAHATKVLFFSFVTLTTLGYGDIVPRGELMHMLTTFEAIIGQLYVAIFIARLVALYAVSDRADREAMAAKEES